MRKKDPVFRFKRFGVRHEKSSMRIGVDAVLLGAWAGVEEASRILDVGTGCGIVALMCAQRNSDAAIDAIDIDEASVEEARGNFSTSPWGNRMTAIMADFTECYGEVGKTYDYIISNPPYFDSGIQNPESSRLKARHQDILSPLVFVKKASELLEEGGKTALVMPSADEEKLLSSLKGETLQLIRRLLVRGNPNREIKRVLLEFQKNSSERFCQMQALENANTEILTVETSPGVHTGRYIELEKEFFLKL